MFVFNVLLFILHFSNDFFIFHFFSSCISFLSFLLLIYFPKYFYYFFNVFQFVLKNFVLLNTLIFLLSQAVRCCSVSFILLPRHNLVRNLSGYFSVLTETTFPKVQNEVRTQRSCLTLLLLLFLWSVMIQSNSHFLVSLPNLDLKYFFPFSSFFSSAHFWLCSLWVGRWKGIVILLARGLLTGTPQFLGAHSTAMHKSLLFLFFVLLCFQKPQSALLGLFCPWVCKQEASLFSCTDGLPSRAHECWLCGVILRYLVIRFCFRYCP